MPHATLKVGLGYSEDIKQKLAGKVAGDIADTLGVDPKWVSVTIEEVPFPDWKQKVWIDEITEKKDRVYIKPGYEMV